MTTTTRPVPEHGTRARYLRGCGCTPCGDAHRTYMARYRLQRHRGQQRRVPAGPVADRVRTLADEGWSNRQIADAARCTRRVVDSLLRGDHATISAAIAARILAATPTPASCAPDTYIPPTGSMRRVRALIALGYTLKSIAEAIDMAEGNVTLLINGRRTYVTARHAHAIAETFRRWQARPGPSQRSRNHASRQGWAPPAAWDDIDDPDEQPSLGAHVPRYIALAEDGMWLETSLGYSREQAAARLGITRDYLDQSITRWRREQRRATAGTEAA